MKIYSNITKPEGLGSESFNPAEVYQSGYSAGYAEGYEEGLASCPYLEVSPESLSFPTSGGESVISVSSNMPWSVDSDSPFFILSTNSGEGDGTVIVTAGPNESLSSRTSVISFYYADEDEPQAEVNVEQSAASPYLTQVNNLPDGYGDYIPSGGGDYTLTVSANTPWTSTVIPYQDLASVTLSPVSGGSGVTQVSVHAGPTSVPNSGNYVNINIVLESVYFPDMKERVFTAQRTPEAYLTETDDMPIVYSPDYRWIPSGGGDYTMTVTTNIQDIHGPDAYSWYMDNRLEGWTISPLSGRSGSTLVTLHAEPNASVEELDGYIWIKDTMGFALDVNMSITQYGAEAYLTLDDDTPQTVPSGGGDYTITVSANTSWSALNSFFSSTLTPDSGESGETQILFHVPENLEHAVLGGQIDFYGLSGETHERLNVSQDAAPQPVPTNKYVRDLIEEGYANVVTGCNGDYVSILSSCPYAMSQVLDLKENALGTTGTTDTGKTSILIWDQTLPSGWTSQDIADLYSGETLPHPLRAHQFWSLGAISSFTLDMANATWSFPAYPWSPGTTACPAETNGAFAPRYNSQYENYYAQMGFRNTPENVTINFRTYTSVSQVLFTQMRTTTALTLNVMGEWNVFDCHDGAGMFESCHNLENLSITGNFYWSSFLNANNLFQACRSLTRIPYSNGWNNTWTREHQRNELFPHYNGTRGNANLCYMFDDCRSLEYIGPVLNMEAASLSGCTWTDTGGNSYNQVATNGPVFNTPVLTDVRLKNLGHNDWSFIDTSTYTYIPSMNAASIEYLLNNVMDVTAEGGHTLTFADTHENEVDSAAVQHAETLGWTIIWQSME